MSGKTVRHRSGRDSALFVDEDGYLVQFSVVIHELSFLVFVSIYRRSEVFTFDEESSRFIVLILFQLALLQLKTL